LGEKIIKGEEKKGENVKKEERGKKRRKWEVKGFKKKINANREELKEKDDKRN
jgi:hypothetical protein